MALEKEMQNLRLEIQNLHPRYQAELQQKLSTKQTEVDNLVKMAKDDLFQSQMRIKDLEHQLRMH